MNYFFEKNAVTASALPPTKTIKFSFSSNLQQFPFATTNTAIGDLAKFYRECFNAPPLQQFNEVSADDENSIEDLTKQLEQFETSMENYDTLVTSLCCHSIDSNSNS
jgi:autophagy-related protein 13